MNVKYILNSNSYIHLIVYSYKVWGISVEIQAAVSLFQMKVYEVTDSYVVGKAEWLQP